jgi:hypothetical protein
MFSVTLSGDRCRTSPIVINATVSLDASQKLLTVKCFSGHRFPSGLATELYRCNGDGTWNNIEPCKRISIEFRGFS